jgi:O-antigen ligase
MAMFLGMQKPRDMVHFIIIAFLLWGLFLGAGTVLATIRSLGPLAMDAFSELLSAPRSEFLSTFARFKELLTATLSDALRSIQSTMSTAESDFSRSQINAVALDLFKQSPWFGQGLGGFLERSPQTLGYSIGIHNTWLWVLVDFGLLGFSLALLMVSLIFAYVIRARLWCSPDPYQRAFLLGLVCFAFFSQLHEMSFQRIMWFCLGLLLAAPRQSAATAQSCELVQDSSPTQLLTTESRQPRHA